MKMALHTRHRDKIQNRLSRIAGQVAGLQKMVQDERGCVDVLTQVAALRSALDAVGVELLSDHISNCLAGCGEAGGETGNVKKRSNEQLLEEVRLTLSRFLG
jgi:CsoR family transcriptional regulator, copper-sensing transcriptional repressor